MNFPSFKGSKSLLYSRFIICGGYCAGKTSLLERMEKKLGIPKLIDHSTRKMREGEREGFPYHFISRNEFENNLALGSYYEWVEFCGNYYGVPREEIFRREPWSLDTLTATYLSKYKDKVPKTFGIFLQSPSDQTILERAKTRGDNMKKIKHRLLHAKAETPEGFDLILTADLDLEEKLELIVKHITKEHR